MKRVIVVLVIAFMGSAVTVNAQKIGHINTNELLAVMPETKKAQDKLQKSQDSLNVVYAELIKEFREQDSIFGADSAKWTPAKRDIKRNDLGNLYTKVQGYQNEAQQFLQQKEQEVYGPVQKVALEAIQTVAKNNGYAYVFSREALIVVPASDDLLPLVKKFLKIADTPGK
jgi:outer membrane protein